VKITLFLQLYVIPGLIAAIITMSMTSNSYSRDKPEFNGDSAWNYLIAQCDYGPRNPGSSGARACQDFLERELRKYTDSVRLQPFTHYDARLKTTFYMNNIIADFAVSEGPIIVLCAHWDTRPRADMDPNPANRNTPILGANDGASGVAALLEMARLFSIDPPRFRCR